MKLTNASLDPFIHGLAHQPTVYLVGSGNFLSGGLS